MRIVLIPLLCVPLFLGGCPEAEDSPEDELLVAAYTAPREALDQALFPAFRALWKARTGRDLRIRASYLGSGAQSRAVAQGFPADVVILAIEPDVERIVKRGLVSPDWRKDTGHGGIVAQTLVVIAVRPNNPLGIRDFADLSRPGIEVLAPNPMTSGGAVWNVLAVYAAAPRGQEIAFLRRILDRVIVMDKGARESIVNFEKGLGDAAITYEQEVHVARLAGRHYDYVIPPVTMRVDIPAAVVDAHVDRKGTRLVAESFLEFLSSDEAQGLLSRYGFRPLTRPLENAGPGFPPPGRILTIHDFGGWERASSLLYGDAGVLQQVIGHP